MLQQTKRIALWYLVGIFGLTQYILHINRTPVEEIEKRKKICKRCPQRTRYKCISCGCFLPAKIRVYTESCPLHFWW